MRTRFASRRRRRPVAPPEDQPNYEPDSAREKALFEDSRRIVLDAYDYQSLRMRANVDFICRRNLAVTTLQSLSTKLRKFVWSVLIEANGCPPPSSAHSINSAMEEEEEEAESCGGRVDC